LIRLDRGADLIGRSRVRPANSDSEDLEYDAN